MNARPVRMIPLVVLLVLAVACSSTSSPTAPASIQAPSAAAGATGGQSGVGSSHASEQIVFSGVVFGAQVNNVTTPIGYWIWCSGDDAGATDVPNLHAVCAGSMRFDALNLTRGVSGTISEQSGIYAMAVSSTDGVVQCTLRNASAALVSGPYNTVLVSCSAPVGGGTSTDGVVKVTGPGH
jgi:hypothetical protein